MLNELSQTQRARQNVISLRCGLEIEAQKRVVVSRD